MCAERDDGFGQQYFAKMQALVYSRNTDNVTYVYTLLMKVTSTRPWMDVYAVLMHNAKPDMPTFLKNADEITNLSYNHTLLEDLAFRCQFSQYREPPPQIGFPIEEQHHLREIYNSGSGPRTINLLYDTNDFNCVLHKRKSDART
eukprot:UN04609